ncbi:MAG: hypothetical protein U0894_05140 [Pirellulales bacterium]
MRLVEKSGVFKIGLPCARDIAIALVVRQNDDDVGAFAGKGFSAASLLATKTSSESNKPPAPVANSEGEENGRSESLKRPAPSGTLILGGWKKTAKESGNHRDARQVRKMV